MSRCRLDDDPAPLASVTPACWCTEACQETGERLSEDDPRKEWLSSSGTAYQIKPLIDDENGEGS